MILKEKPIILKNKLNKFYETAFPLYSDEVKSIMNDSKANTEFSDAIAKIGENGNEESFITFGSKRYRISIIKNISTPPAK